MGSQLKMTTRTEFQNEEYKNKKKRNNWKVTSVVEQNASWHIQQLSASGTQPESPACWCTLPLSLVQPGVSRAYDGMCTTPTFTAKQSYGLGTIQLLTLDNSIQHH